MPRARRRGRRRRAALHRLPHHRRRRADDPPGLRGRRRRTTRASRSSTRSSTGIHEARAPRPRHRALPGPGAARRARATVQDAAERLAFGPDSTRCRRRRPDAARAGLGSSATRSCARAHRPRPGRARGVQGAPLPAGRPPLKYVIVATGNIYDDALQAKAAAVAGADIVAVIRATAQSLLDYVPDGATTEGYGGTFATQENFRIIRRALRRGEPPSTAATSAQTNYSSGPVHGRDRVDGRRRAARHAAQRRDVRHPLSRHQHVPHLRRPVRLAAVHRASGHRHQHRRGQLPDDRRRRREGAHRARQPVHQRGVRASAPACARSRSGWGTRSRSTRGSRTACSLEIAQAQLVRQIFPRHPIKWMPPTKHKTGDIFSATCTGRDVQPRRRDDRAVHRAARHVQRGRSRTRCSWTATWR